MNRRSWQAAAALALCIALVAAALGWMTGRLIGLEKADAQARAEAVLEENVRLALWRMDSSVASLVAAESAQPPFAYSAYYSLSRAYMPEFNQAPANDKDVIPSRLLTSPPAYVRVYFQVDESGGLTSPQVPTGRFSNHGSGDLGQAAKSGEARRRLNQLSTWLSRKDLAALPPADPSMLNWPPRIFEKPTITLNLLPDTDLPRAQSQTQLGESEFGNRSQFVSQNSAITYAQGVDESDFFHLDVGMMNALWMGHELVLARRVMLGLEQFAQGCWLDWPQIQTQLLSQIRDLLPEARLEPDPKRAASPSRLLAALPARLVPGRLAAGAVVSDASSWQWSLALAWIGFLVAAVALALLLAGVVALSERRASFVSAVTHELRTPLTTFRVYTEMLADDMITEPGKRRSYLQTLRTEADRLAHLVENVLAYARLERGRRNGPTISITAAALVEGVRPRLAERAQQANMQLVIQFEEAATTAVLDTDAAAVEQILFNLVDNACKYAAAATDRRIVLSIAAGRRQVRLVIRDFGPGIEPREARRLFRPFSKSAREAAATAPGVGLGLALSRRLARTLGGDVEYEPAAGVGASFALTLTNREGA